MVQDGVIETTCFGGLLYTSYWYLVGLCCFWGILLSSGLTFVEATPRLKCLAISNNATTPTQTHHWSYTHPSNTSHDDRWLDTKAFQNPFHIPTPAFCTSGASHRKNGFVAFLGASWVVEVVAAGCCRKATIKNIGICKHFYTYIHAYSIYVNIYICICI